MLAASLPLVLRRALLNHTQNPGGAPSPPCNSLSSFTSSASSVFIPRTHSLSVKLMCGAVAGVIGTSMYGGRVGCVRRVCREARAAGRSAVWGRKPIPPLTWSTQFAQTRAAHVSESPPPLQEGALYKALSIPPAQQSAESNPLCKTNPEGENP
ncbi:hypothetical protein BDK51DRAFT_50676 [Blyttiomyces helicus]|uniref:Uncharacterized protein n=1 Tax=Blyttiomyces helicus TaxID=388810 RepID=A0A4P9W1T9_9FUNG|nr:hypothetical protein BDK51DRAFT_50676 [Blyttiomyces helicus]|eukprot:RKO86161.1 hypothetical protein BDK51DRAFT_50676 [Blyttiomyces helicus]